jgi:spore coat polysaccharide biosynthesis predicted glycosyltransferase SpsG
LQDIASIDFSSAHCPTSFVLAADTSIRGACPSMSWKSVFVTVGTTEFDDLIALLGTDKFFAYLLRHQCQRLVIQYGRGREPPLTSAMKKNYELNQIELIAYRFKDSLDMDMKEADLIISHAGNVHFISSRGLLIQIRRWVNH